MKIDKTLLSFGAGLFMGSFMVIAAMLYHKSVEIKQKRCVTWARDTLGEIERCFSEFTTKGEGRFLDTSTGVSGFELVSSVAFFPSGNATGQFPANTVAKMQFFRNLPTVYNEAEPDREKICDSYAETVQMNTSGDDLFHEVRILCWIMTSPTTLYTKAVHINATWARHCNKVIFISSKDDRDFPAVGVRVQEGRNFLYDKVRKGFSYAWDHHKDDADWFLKADDDTYVIVENLRFLLKHYNPSRALYFGRRFKPYAENGYMSGGAGYVLSRAALQKFVIALQSRRCLQYHGRAEDIALGLCMGLIGVKAMDTRDSDDKETFFPFSPKAHLTPWGIPSKAWFWKYIYYPSSKGLNSCSDFAISFHYITPSMMYQMEYFVYHLKAVGIPKLNQLRPKEDKITEKHKELAKNIR